MSNENVKIAEDQVAAAIAAEKTAREDLSGAKKDLKKAQAYAKNPPEGEAEQAAQLERDWAAEVTNRQTAAEAAKEQVKTAREALKAAKAEAKAEASEKAAVEKIVQNGQTRPRDDSRSGKVWALFDQATAERGDTAAVADVLQEAMAIGMTEGSVRSAYSHWRKFNGIEKGRISPMRAVGMSEERRVAKVEKLQTQLAKIDERREKLIAQLDALSVPAAAVTAEAQATEVAGDE